ncbi:prepilin-type N-terminal cleavage/methylation domain-containing protein [Pseudomonas sp. R-28-1W-6]|uniref:GspH/FimT family pseudopilin n=1 Tax=Pseudomonas sp. R-28-1W-6 TaxID=2650101 RepID=UPI001365ED0E|nr:GspH/FimT family pseudopilin [Pseudomonas sp. R-28-1W-6]MWV11767.1 prepilin-type N-terminal cleavage/methylation domain-containing protein [Pseudomonas sp. R-28-1W-6]
MRPHGFTLIELLTALAITATLSFLVVPATSALIAKQRLNAGLGNFTNSLKYARTYAVLHQTGVTLLAQQSDWGAGWTVFEDPNSNAIQDDGEHVLLSREPSETLIISGNTSIASYVHFNMYGEPQLSSGGFQAGTLIFCSPASPDTHHKLIMAKTGRVRISSSVDSTPCSPATGS